MNHTLESIYGDFTWLWSHKFSQQVTSIEEDLT